MAQRLVDRAEKGAALALPFRRGEPIGNTVEVFILPAVVARQALDIGTVDHGVLITVMAGHSRTRTASLWSPMPAIHVSLARLILPQGKKTQMPGTKVYTWSLHLESTLG